MSFISSTMIKHFIPFFLFPNLQTFTYKGFVGSSLDLLPLPCSRYEVGPATLKGAWIVYLVIPNFHSGRFSNVSCSNIFDLRTQTISVMCCYHRTNLFFFCKSCRLLPLFPLLLVCFKVFFVPFFSVPSCFPAEHLSLTCKSLLFKSLLLLSNFFLRYPHTNLRFLLLKF